MKRGLKIVVSWLCLFSLLISPLTASGAGTTSGDPVWPNPGAIQLSKTAEPTGKSGEWKITLKAEGKNIKSSSDVVLVIDKSGSMDDRDWWWETDYKLADARTAAKKFVDNLLLNGSSTRIAVVSFNKSATNVSDFKGPSQKDALKTSIDNISASGGTNIQAGLKNARDLLANSSAQNKVIVVLSDGEPTYSFKGTQAKSSSWQNNSYSFAITKFDYGTTLGTGGDYDLSKSSRYEINNFSVKDNGIGTISEAKLAKDAGLKIFSVGLDVSKNSNAIKVLKDVQNEGYFSANSDELNTIFREMAGKISYAAQGAKVIDPMGDMFNLKLQGAQISPADYTVSQGTVTWDAATEKFNWNVGNIAEGEPATFTYTVVMDQSKNPVSNTLYPTNGKTTMEYTDVNNQKVSKDFEVPKVSIGNGSILMKGYKVNANGKPINAEGVEVEAPEFAEALYSEYYKDQNGKEAFPMGSTHSVPAKTVAGYQLKVGESPRNVTLTVTNPSPVIWFGYTAAVEQTVTVKYLEKDSGKQLKDPTFQKGFSGSKVELKALLVDGYSVVAPDKLEYTFTSEPNQVHTFFYTANEQNVTVKYLKKGTTDEVAPSTTVKGLTGETIELTAANAPGYTPEKATDSYTIKAEGNNEYIFYYTASEQNVTVKYLKKGTTDEVAPSTIVKGLTGQTIELTAANAPGYTPEKATDNYTIKAEGTNEYIFYYTASEQSVTVKYLKKGTTDEVAPSTTVKGLTGQTIELTAANALGYTPEKATDNYTIKAEGTNEYIFYYTAKEQNVTVKYLKKGTTDEVAPSTTVKGLTGETIELTAANAPGYTPEKATASYTIKAEGNNEYIFYYTASEQNVEVKYLEQGTNKVLAEPTTANGVTGQTIELKAKDIAGYTAVEPTHSYKLDVENAAHVFYYTANTQSVSVKYVDRETGKEIAEATSVNGVTGDTVTLEAKDVAGYTPEKATDSYTLKAEGNEYTFYYTANAQSVEVQYLEQGTNKVLAEPTTANGVTGQTIELKAKDIAGYTAVEPTHSYKLDVENAAHVFYYTA
ncbi:MucBP domain-containing protein, partial [Paenibacillus sp. Marseille-P2973]|uniref:MucBP domain-containing protein n=1 Tax=Paenibacillus sp. Marseille-P2973 TaxID=1871032 RepID=UPI001B398389